MPCSHVNTVKVYGSSEHTSSLEAVSISAASDCGLLLASSACPCWINLLSKSSFLFLAASKSYTHHVNTNQYSWSPSCFKGSMKIRCQCDANLQRQHQSYFLQSVYLPLHVGGCDGELVLLLFDVITLHLKLVNVMISTVNLLHKGGVAVLHCDWGFMLIILFA